MDEKRTVQEEIEESLRICEEILNNNPDIISEKPDINLEEVLRGTDRESSYTAPPKQEEQPAVQSIRPLEIKHEEETSWKMESDQKTRDTAPIRQEEQPTIQGIRPWKIDQEEEASWKMEPDQKTKDTVPVRREEQPAVQSIQPLEIKHEEETSWKMKPDQKTKEKAEEVPKKSAKTGTKKRGIVRTLVSILVCIAIAVAAAFLITHFVANHTTVEGSSMEPCLGNGDELIVEKISYLTGKPERFDVVVFKFNENTNYIKRVIGLPGEKVRIEEGKIYINDKAIFDEHANGVMEDAGIAEKTVSLGTDEYFVLGDNRNASKDSRHKDVGIVKGDQIIGKAWLRMMPFDDFGFIK